VEEFETGGTLCVSSDVRAWGIGSRIVAWLGRDTEGHCVYQAITNSSYIWMFKIWNLSLPKIWNWSCDPSNPPKWNSYCFFKQYVQP
jgi:hypothetical protein